jgi:hypothetical protein
MTLLTRQALAVILKALEGAVSARRAWLFQITNLSYLNWRTIIAYRAVRWIYYANSIAIFTCRASHANSLTLIRLVCSFRTFCFYTSLAVRALWAELSTLKN